MRLTKGGEVSVLAFFRCMSMLTPLSVKLLLSFCGFTLLVDFGGKLKEDVDLLSSKTSIITVLTFHLTYLRTNP